MELHVFHVGDVLNKREDELADVILIMNEKLKPPPRVKAGKVMINDTNPLNRAALIFVRKYAKIINFHSPEFCFLLKCIK